MDEKDDKAISRPPVPEQETPRPAPVQGQTTSREREDMIFESVGSTTKSNKT